MRNRRKEFISFEKMILSQIYFLFISVFVFFIGRYYYNHCFELYDYEKEKANNYFKKFILKLNTPKKIKFMGFLLMLLSFIGFIFIFLKLISNLLKVP